MNINSISIMERAEEDYVLHQSLAALMAVLIHDYLKKMHISLQKTSISEENKEFYLDVPTIYSISRKFRRNFGPCDGPCKCGGFLSLDSDFIVQIYISAFFWAKNNGVFCDDKTLSHSILDIYQDLKGKLISMRMVLRCDDCGYEEESGIGNIDINYNSTDFDVDYLIDN